MLLKVFLIYSIFLIFKIFAEYRAVYEYCEPDNEFENNDELSKLWNNVMNLLDDFTFKNHYSIGCENDSSKNVTIDAKGDFLWNLRFKLYNETKSSENHTLQDCYSVGNNATEKSCDTEKFQNCMKFVRQAMLFKLVGDWDGEIQKELKQLAKDC